MTNIYMIDNITQKGGEKIQINVVGSISNPDEINEIETVAKVFVVAERMIDLTGDLKADKIDTFSPSVKNIKKTNGDNNTNLTLLNVRGLN